MSKETTEERLKRMGAKSHDQVLDEQIGLKGSKERDEYENELAKELDRLVKNKNRSITG